MEHIIFTEYEKYDVALLIKQSAFIKSELENYYISEIDTDKVIGLSLTYNEQGKAPASLIKESLQYILKASVKLGVTTLLVADANYFKILTKNRKAEPYYGYVCDCKVDGFEDLKVILVPNYQSLFYNPDIKDRLDMGIGILNKHLKGESSDLGANIIHSSKYLYTLDSIQEELDKLHNFSSVTCDIETLSLRFEEADIVSIAFAWDRHNGIAIYVNGSKEIKDLLRRFFDNYQGTLIFHNATFDIRVLIYELYMNDYLDYKGLLTGLDIMYRDIHDTKIITYLATNSTAGNNLSLKHNAFEFAGNYAVEEIGNVASIPVEELLKYNLVDCLSTFYVYEKNYPVVLKENQEDIYRDIMLPSLKVITNMELVGMPLDVDQLKVTEKDLIDIENTHRETIAYNKYVREYEWTLQRKAFVAAHNKWKKKTAPIEDFKTTFNPNSGVQLQGLLYEHMGLPVIELTDNGAPSTSTDTLEKLLEILKNE